MSTYGLRLKLNHVYPETWTQRFMPRLSQLWALIPLGIRFFFYCIYIWIRGRTPLMDYFHVLNSKQMYGVPLGGIGAGSIGRGFKGEFCRYQLRPGIYRYKTMAANQFIVTIRNTTGDTLYQKVLTAAGKPKNVLNSWDWSYPGQNAEYVGLYPRSWTTFSIPECGVELICRQVSPVIPNNYEDSCLPAAMFLWTVKNKSDSEKHVSITMTFQNGIGESGDKDAGCSNSSFVDDKYQGVFIKHRVGRMGYTYAVTASVVEKDTELTILRDWNPLGDGLELWQPLYQYGKLPGPPSGDCPVTKKGQQLAGAVCVKNKVASSSASQMQFGLVWDMPMVEFDLGGRQYYKYYTKYYDRTRSSTNDLVRYCHEHVAQWEQAIEAWQSPILDDPDLPDWYKSAIFNETYFLSDGGTVWLDIDDEEAKLLPDNDPRKQFGRFAYLEGHEYRMYNTYDVHFYASFALSHLWPGLQASVQMDFKNTVAREDKSRQWHLFEGDISERKVKNSIPHDLGDPGEEPFAKINAYPIHDVSEWRDLDLKFVLQTYRDYSVTKDLDQLQAMWYSVCLLMKNALRWDKDGDGLIENHGVPDQTYDTWTMSGPSAYCGGLWLAALQCTCEMAELLGDTTKLTYFAEILARAKAAFDSRLWNGQYYNFDCSGADRSKSIMSDQLCGLWYLKCSGLDNKILPEDQVKSALTTVYKFNVMGQNQGSRGAVNGMLPDGTVDEYTIQSEEIWTGVTYGLASLMIHQGMIKEAFNTASGIYKTVYEQIGLGYETPEALYTTTGYRSIGYMRPLSIWSVQLAWEMRKSKMAAKSGKAQ